MEDTNHFRRRTFFPLFFLGALFLLGAVVMWLWNAILPEVASLGRLNYWQALGLLVLCRLLFGGFPGGRRGPFAHRRFARRGKEGEAFLNMNEEEREAFKARWEKHCKK